MEILYLDDRVSADGGCEAAVTVRARCGWVKFNGCGGAVQKEISSMSGRCCLHELCRANNSVWK